LGLAGAIPPGQQAKIVQIDIPIEIEVAFVPARTGPGRLKV
jgi:hypothetical protein